jgi:hypothetical protein
MFFSEFQELQRKFPREHVFADFRFSSGNENHARAVSLHLPRKWLSGEQLPQSSRTTLEQIPLREILLLREILG